MNKHLAEMMAKVARRPLPAESVILDCYNQAVVKGVAMTVTTRTDAGCQHFLLEPITEPIMKQDNKRIIQVGNLSEREGRPFDNPEHGRVYGVCGISPTLKATESKGPCKILEPVTCALRGRNPENPSDRTAGCPTEQRLELGGDVANCLTSVDKDSMVAVPVYREVMASTQRNAYQGSVDSVSPSLTAAMGTSGTNTPMVTVAVPEPMDGEKRRSVAYKAMPDGSIRGYDPNTADKRGISEEQYMTPDVVSSTVTTAHAPKVIEALRWHYRIRKLHPIETYRLMGLRDCDIAKLIEPVNEKGKPLLSKTKHYELAGNSIVADVLELIFGSLFEDKPGASAQMTFDFGAEAPSPTYATPTT